MNEQANLPSGEPSPSFRQAAMTRLAKESGAQAPTAPSQESLQPKREAEVANDPSLQEDEQGVRQSDVGREPGEEAVILADGESDDQVPEEGSTEYWRVMAEKAEESRSSMEKDYRRKTHKIAEAHRASEDQHQQVVAQAQFFVGMAEQGVKQFDHINWQQLQQDPAQYQQARQAFITAQNYHKQVADALQSVENSVKDRRETAKKREADISREILKSTVPGWNNQMFQDLRAFAAEELDYSPQEVDDLTDWRRIRDIHSQWVISKAKTALNTPPRRKNQPERKSGNAPLPNVRNDKGQFQSARNALAANPGDRSAKHNYFLQKLRNDRRPSSE